MRKIFDLCFKTIIKLMNIKSKIISFSKENDIKIKGSNIKEIIEAKDENFFKYAIKIHIIIKIIPIE